jgi:glycosyltransferase involved in cell wall biosynthesis
VKRDRPRLLLVAPAFPPDYVVGGKRALRMARHLPALGWDVQVLSLRPAYADRLDPTLLEDPLPFEVIRTSAASPILLARRARRSWRRLTAGERAGKDPVAGLPAGASAAVGRWRPLVATPDEYSGWIPFAVAAGMVRVRRPDIILATAPPFSAHLAAAVLSRTRGAALVLDYRDPWSTVEGAGPPRGSRHKGMEAWCVRQARLVVATTSSILDSLKGFRPARTLVIENGCDTEVFARVRPTDFTRFTIVYAGNFYGSRSARPVLQALRSLKDSGSLPAGGVRLRVLGITGDEVVAMARELDVADWVEAEDFLPQREAAARMRGADLLLLVVGETHGGSVPAKLFDYLGAGRFILGIAPPGSEAGRLVAECRAGACFASDDRDGIAGYIAAAAASRSEGLRPPPVPERYTAVDTMRRLDGALRDLVSRGPS